MSRNVDIYSLIRKLAKSNKYQTLFSNFREGYLPLFNNSSEYTDVQILFLNYLSFYFILYSDIAMDYVDEVVLQSEIYEDSYVYYKRKCKGDFDKKKEKEIEKKPSSNNEEKITSNRTNWVFKNKPK